MKNTQQEEQYLVNRNLQTCFDIGRAKTRAFEFNSGNAGHN